MEGQKTATLTDRMVRGRFHIFFSQQSIQINFPATGKAPIFLDASLCQSIISHSSTGNEISFQSAAFSGLYLCKINSLPFPELVIKCLKFETQKQKNSHKLVLFLSFSRSFMDLSATFRLPLQKSICWCVYDIYSYINYLVL